MKLTDCIIEPMPHSGEVPIDVAKAIKGWKKTAAIYNWNNSYRLISRHSGIKITISNNDAQELIQRLKMVESKDNLFANASVFRRKQDWEWYLSKASIKV